MKKLDQIKKIISEAKLSDGEKIDLYMILTSLPNEDENQTFDLIIEKPDIIYKIVENYNKKKEIVKNCDKQAWQELLKEEEKELEALAKEE